ncbi:MAG: FAD-dependent thymidylate synthase [Acidobacteriota bacterium]
MDIKLAGFNIDKNQLDTVAGNKKELLTPEIFSAAYARISRSSKSVTELRKEALSDVEKARISNKKIIFGMGHHSVAEHAVFNFDVIGLSRLALEELERFRLVSYTEKSQRYVTLKGDFIIPPEIKGGTDEKKFLQIIEKQNSFYNKSYLILKDLVFSENRELALDKKNKSLLEGWAKEDARYILSLATAGQVGLTINARNLEHLFRHFSLSDFEEVKNAGKKMYEITEKIAPSILLFPEPSKFEKNIVSGFKENFKYKKKKAVSKDPVILDYDKNGDDLILASYFALENSIDFSEAFNYVKNLSKEKKGSIYKDLFKNMEFFDFTPRNFEIPDITFQAVVSASNFAQLKRHRMATLLTGNYRIDLGNKVPENISKAGLDKEFLEIINETNNVYFNLQKKYGNSANYVLTNSHMRQVIMKMNMREIYHFIRLRSDNHAQWDIKELADKLLDEIRKILPLSSMLLCGKDSFDKNFENIYNKNPEFTI